MKFMLFVLPTVPATLEERERLRPIRRNNDRYQMMLDEPRKLGVFADDAGFDVMSTTEHHFHSEGYECSVAPLLARAWDHAEALESKPSRFLRYTRLMFTEYLKKRMQDLLGYGLAMEGLASMEQINPPK
jgi:hypothetical protein